MGRIIFRWLLVCRCMEDCATGTRQSRASFSASGDHEKSVAHSAMKLNGFSALRVSVWPARASNSSAPSGRLDRRAQLRGVALVLGNRDVPVALDASRVSASVYRTLRGERATLNSWSNPTAV